MQAGAGCARAFELVRVARGPCCHHSHIYIRCASYRERCLCQDARMGRGRQRTPRIPRGGSPAVVRRTGTCAQKYAVAIRGKPPIEWGAMLMAQKPSFMPRCMYTRTHPCTGSPLLPAPSVYSVARSLCRPPATTLPRYMNQQPQHQPWRSCFERSATALFRQPPFIGLLEAVPQWLDLRFTRAVNDSCTRDLLTAYTIYRCAVPPKRCTEDVCYFRVL